MRSIWIWRLLHVTREVWLGFFIWHLLKLHLICTFMNYLQGIPHFFCRFALRDPEKLIWIQTRGYYVFSNAIKFGLLAFWISPLRPRLFNGRSIFFKLWDKMTIFNCIPNSFVKWFYKDFHSHFPKMVVQTTKQRWSFDWSTFPKR